MTQQLTHFAIAAACVCTLGLRADAQETKVNVDHGKTVTYTGCIQTGSQSDSYILANVVPMAKTETRGTTGTTDETTYALIPEKMVTLHEHVGQRAEVTGVVIKPGHGDAKIETKTRENGETTGRTKEEVKRGPLPQFRVVSVKPLGQRCE
jgi:hypothetical protein